MSEKEDGPFPFYCNCGTVYHNWDEVRAHDYIAHMIVLEKQRIEEWQAEALEAGWTPPVSQQEK